MTDVTLPNNYEALRTLCETQQSQLSHQQAFIQNLLEQGYWGNPIGNPAVHVPLTFEGTVYDQSRVAAGLVTAGKCGECPDEGKDLAFTPFMNTGAHKMGLFTGIVSYRLKRGPIKHLRKTSGQ